MNAKITDVRFPQLNIRIVSLQVVKIGINLRFETELSFQDL